MAVEILIFIVIGVLAAIAVPWTVYRRKRKYSELSYEKIGPIPLYNIEDVSLTSTIQHRLQVRVDDAPAERLDTCIVRLRSTGSLSIEYDQQSVGAQTPVTINFGKGARMVAVESSDEHKSSSVVDPDNPHQIIVNRLLLNPGESIFVSIFLVEFGGEVEVYGHLRDTRIREQNKRDMEVRLLLPFLQSMVLALGILGFTVAFLPFYAPVLSGYVSYTLTALGGLAVGFGLYASFLLFLLRYR